MINNKKALFAALFYVGFGSMVLLMLFPNDIFYNEYAIFLLIITLPTNFLSTAIRYSCTDCNFIIILVQFLFLIIWYKFFSKRIK